MTRAQCTLCKAIIDSKWGLAWCECDTIAVDDGRVIAYDFDYVIEMKEE